MLKRLLGIGLVVGLVGGCGGDSGGGGSGGGGKKVDACSIVGQTDAEALFGAAAVQDTGAATVDPALLGECLWVHDEPGVQNQLLQFRVWDGTGYYSAAGDSQPFAIGDGGNIRLTAGVDVSWTQSDRTVELSYSSAGPGAPDASAKVDAMKALANQAAQALAK